jgi:hypothetical protein
MVLCTLTGPLALADATALSAKTATQLRMAADLFISLVIEGARRVQSAFRIP